MVIDTNLAEQVRDHLLRVRVEEEIAHHTAAVALYKHLAENSATYEGGVFWRGLEAEYKVRLDLLTSLMPKAYPDPMEFVNAEAFIDPMRPVYAVPDRDDEPGVSPEMARYQAEGR